MSSLIPIPLCSNTLSSLSSEIKVPSYDRSTVTAGIVHVGIGGFHRSHQAYYTDKLMEEHGVKDWGICGIALLKYDRKIYDTLVAQNGLYTLLITEADGTPSAQVIGSIVEYLYAPEDPEAVIEKMAHPNIKVITLTITEGGYNFNPATGEFMLETPSIQKDIQNPTAPETIFGFLTQSLKRRMERGLAGLTVQSCDNIQQNGAVAKKMFLAYIAAAAPELLSWVESNVTFPNSMVDRITPVTAPADIALLQERFQLADGWPVVCEPFCQWVIEDEFSAGRPAWDLVGAQFVTDVHAHEKMKIRMLNGGHMALAFTGLLHPFTYVSEYMAHPLFSAFLDGFMRVEVTPILDPVPGIDLDTYRETLISRFGNPNIRDQLTRLAGETSAKAPKFMLATINDHLARSPTDATAVKRCALVLACWCRYIELSVPHTDEGSQHQHVGYTIIDAEKDLLVEYATASRQSGQTDRFLHIHSLFGDLAQQTGFVAVYCKLLESLRNEGIDHILTHLHEY